MPSRIPHDERVSIIALSKAGHSQRAIKEATGRSLGAINRVVQAYCDDNARIGDAPHGRRPRATTEDEDRLIVAAVADNPFQGAGDIRAAVGLSVSDTTVRRRLHEAGVRSHRAAQKPFLTMQNNAAPICRGAPLVDCA